MIFLNYGGEIIKREGNLLKNGYYLLSFRALINELRV